MGSPATGSESVAMRINWPAPLRPVDELAVDDKRSSILHRTL